MLNKTDVVHVLSPAKRAAQRDESFICLTPPPPETHTHLYVHVSCRLSPDCIGILRFVWVLFFFSPSLPSVLRPGISHAFR